MDKKLIVSFLAIVSLVIVAPSPGRSQKAPIRIGFLAPVTGGGAAVGKDMTNAFTMSIEEIGMAYQGLSYQMAGRKVDVIIEDTQGDPAQALTKLRKLVENDNVHVVAGGFLASEGYALAPKIDEYRIPTLFPVVSADDLTQRKPVKWLVRTGWSSSQPNQPFGEYVAKTLGYKKIVTIAMDYAFGWE
jgi:branched-chain amino acid transport system substrate-binding protein